MQLSYIDIAIKLALGLLSLVIVINISGKGNLAPTSASDLRNQGIAREMMEAIYLLAKTQTIHFLRIDTHLNNKIMRKFLSNFGFEERGIIKLTMKNILDDKERVAYELEVR